MPYDFKMYNDQIHYLYVISVVKNLILTYHHIFFQAKLSPLFIEIRFCFTKFYIKKWSKNKHHISSQILFFGSQKKTIILPEIKQYSYYQR